jgi:tetratricopeptide (TPR) repeat protein
MTTDVETGRPCGLSLRTVALLLMSLASWAAAGTPFVPTDDAVVLAHLPARTALDRLLPRRSAVSARNEDLPAALDLARSYIAIGRQEGDPRFIGYAEAVLIPWLKRTPSPEPALVLQATALQYRHQFDESLHLLDRAIALQPLDGQAWLTKASLLELQGRFPEARHACARVSRALDQVLALTCLASVNSRNGQLAASSQALRSVSALTARLPPLVLGWTESVLADMAERSGDDEAADGQLRAAISALPDDPYLKTTRADLLLRVGRPQEVISLTRDYVANDSLLLRLAIAAQRAKSPDAHHWSDEYAARLQAAERDRDPGHARERALYLLEITHDTRGALAAAVDNWKMQREPVDVRLYVRAAQLAGSTHDLELIKSWLAATRYEDETLGTERFLEDRRRP